MNIYFSKEIDKIYFFGDAVSFPLLKTITKVNRGLSFVVFCMCNGINDIEQIEIELVRKFNIKDREDNIRKMVLSNTIEDDDIKKAFTLDIEKSNHSLQVYGTMGKRYPQLLHMELTSTCNFQCGHCYKNATYSGEYVAFDWIKEKIYEKFKGSIQTIHLTGGEPTLHRDFDSIVNLFSSDYDLQLTTNGSRIRSFSEELFKKFKAIDISLYGLTSEDYLSNTGCFDAFCKVKDGCIMLSEADIDFRVTLVLNNENWNQMENYVQYAISVGAKRIGFALPSNGGKLLHGTSDRWHLTSETKRMIYREFRNVQSKYNDKIMFTEWERSKYSDMWKAYPENDSLRCGAGARDWWISEKYKFRPCSFLPDEYMSLDYDTWYGYIMNEQELDWSNARSALELFASNNNLDITDICPVFQKIEEKNV